MRVNFLQCVECIGQEEHEWAWVTDLNLTAANFGRVAQGGRTRWRIENETFNTLKNQGYHFEHNYGHGEKHLAVVLALLMMPAFLIDQVQQRCNPLFRQAWARRDRNVPCGRRCGICSPRLKCRRCGRSTSTVAAA